MEAVFIPDRVHPFPLLISILHLVEEENPEDDGVERQKGGTEKGVDVGEGHDAAKTTPPSLPRASS
jgi:hypothetical protein